MTVSVIFRAQCESERGERWRQRPRASALEAQRTSSLPPHYPSPQPFQHNRDAALLKKKTWKNAFNEDNNEDEPEMSAVIVPTRSFSGLITSALRGRCSQFSALAISFCETRHAAPRRAPLLTSRVWIRWRCIAAAAHPLTRRDSEKIVLERQGNSSH